MFQKHFWLSSVLKQLCCFIFLWKPWYVLFTRILWNNTYFKRTALHIHFKIESVPKLGRLTSWVFGPRFLGFPETLFCLFGFFEAGPSFVCGRPLSASSSPSLSPRSAGYFSPPGASRSPFLLLSSERPRLSPMSRTAALRAGTH